MTNGLYRSRAYTRIADHQAVAAAAKEAPGQWQFVGVYEKYDVAHSTATLIRSGRLAAYAPAGAFEVWRTFTHAHRGLWVRYVTGVTPGPEVPEDVSEAVRLAALWAAGQSRYVSAGQLAFYLDGLGYAPEAENVRWFISLSGGRKSAFQALAYLHEVDTKTGDTK